MCIHLYLLFLYFFTFHQLFTVISGMYLKWVGWFMVFNATFNNISVISWRSVLLVEETGVHGENHRPATSHSQTLSHNVVVQFFSLNIFYLPIKQTKWIRHKLTYEVFFILEFVTLNKYIKGMQLLYIALITNQ